MKRITSRQQAVCDDAQTVHIAGRLRRLTTDKGIKPANIYSRLWYAKSASWSSYGPTEQHIEQFGYAIEGLDAVTKRIKVLQGKLPELQQAVIDAGGPWTSGAPIIGG